MAKEIATKKAPAAVGPYSQALEVGPFVFCSGQIPLNPQTGALEGDTAAEQAEQVFCNIEAVLAEAGLSMKDVVKSTVFLCDLKDFVAVNEVYARHFVKPYPARSCVEGSERPKGAMVECEVIAAKNE